MYQIDRMKKDFQKAIGAIRKEMNSQYPKAMMTGQQMRKNTATVNCGGEHRSEQYSVELACQVIDDKRFKEFLTTYNATAEIEKNPFGGFQIRLHFR